VERCELWFKPVGEKPVFKLHLQVETWFWKGFVTGFGMFTLERHSGLAERGSHDYRSPWAGSAIK
jgi:hypothetical protein